MKKIMIIMLMCSAILFGCQEKGKCQIQLYSAGTGGNIANITTRTVDTIVNTTTEYFITKTNELNKSTTCNYVHYFTCATLTGTPATVTVVQEGSFNGTNWFRLTGASGTDGNNCDTLTFTPTTATQYKMTSNVGGGKHVYGTDWFNVGSRVLYTRLRFIPTGTQTARITDVRNLTFIK
jgi:hypothetical protein